MLKKPQINHNHNKKSTIIANLGVKARTAIAIVLSCIVTIFFSLYCGSQSINSFDKFMVLVYEKVNQPLEQIHKFIKFSRECAGHKDEKDNILAENQYLKQQNLKMAILEKENLELKKFHRYLNNAYFHYITTSIVSTSNDSLGLQAMLNVGTEDGVLEGQAVVNPEGIVGRVVRVSQKSARILPWYNQNFKVPILLLKSGIHCIANGANDHMALLYLPENIEPIEGEIAITSGEGGIIPFGLKVGAVSVDNTTENEFILKPATDLDLFTVVAVAISVN